MITPSHLNTNSVLGLNTKYLKLILILLHTLAQSPATWQLQLPGLLLLAPLGLSDRPPLHGCLLPVQPEPDLLADAVDVDPGIYQADVISTRHLQQYYAAIAALLLTHPEKGDFLSMFAHLTVTKCDTFRSDARFSYFRCETFKISHNFPFLVIPETKEERYKKDLSNLPNTKKK